MLAGTAKVDITPTESIRMEGMLRAHGAEGVHDPIFAKALVMANAADLRSPAAAACAIVATDTCFVWQRQTDAVRARVEELTGIPAGNILIAAKHSHSGPETHGEGEVEARYMEWMTGRLIEVICQAAGALAPVKAGAASGIEGTISRYRRLLHRDGHVVMNWEPYKPDEIIGPLGEVDPEVGVLRIVDLEDRPVCVLFNHAGHPNVLSGDSYLISAEYPGHAERLLETEFGGLAMFVNGAQGTMDIDGWGPRTWEEMERIGRTLAAAVAEAVRRIEPQADVEVRATNSRSALPARRISDQTLAWADEIIRQTGGTVQPLADGVGDDYLALLYRDLRAVQQDDIPLEQVCIAVGSTAFVSFPGELYTEIGQRIKRASPFERTYVVGLANHSVGYVPTRKANAEGGYAENVRRVDDGAEDVVFEHSLGLLRRVYEGRV